MTGKRTGSVGTCPTCHKRTFRRRKDARQAARRAHPDDHMAAYACPTGDGWHYGHLPTDVRKGRATRGEVYSDTTTRRTA